MNNALVERDQTGSILSLDRRQAVALAARGILGAVLVYMGLSKALHPADFLRLLREYEMIGSYLVMNSIAGVLPWFEFACGIALLIGIGVRGAAVLSLAMLVPFSAIVWIRALDIQSATSIAFCAIRFDCGCGGGDVNICAKLLENSFLIFLSAILLAVPARRWSLRYCLLKGS